MKIFTACSKSHMILLGMSQESEVNEPLIVREVKFIDDYGSQGDYGDGSWKQINKDGAEEVWKILEDNIGKKIGTCDTDVIFLKPFVREVYDLLNEYDVLFQRERNSDLIFNPGVAFWNVSQKVIDAWECYIDLSESWDGHLPMQNEIIKAAFHGVKIGLLPIKYATTDNQGLNDDAVLYHANNTPAPGSVMKKFKLMEDSWKYSSVALR